MALKRMARILERFPSGVPERANFYFYGLTLGWVLGDVIGHADADEIEELLAPLVDRDVIDAIPYGRDLHDPDVDALDDDYVEAQLATGWWFTPWMGIKNNTHFFRRAGRQMPDRSTFAWLGHLHGALEGGDISQSEYERLRAMLPAVVDDLTPLVAETYDHTAPS